MDSSITPSSSSATENESSAMVPFNRDTFLSTYNRNQEWSLPDSIIYYISKNASSAKIYGKLIQCCKYFLIRNPPIVIKDLELKQRNNHLEVAFDGELVELNAVPSKIWLTHKLDVITWYLPPLQNSLSAVVSKICQCNIKEMNLLKQICSINHLKVLGSKCEKILFDEIVVMNESGAIVPLEKVFQLFPNAKNFKFYLSDECSMMLTPKTFQELVKIPHFLNLQILDLCEVQESFDLDDFYAYMKNNKKTKIYLDFCIELSDEYRNRLQAIIHEIFSDESRDFKIPSIDFSGPKITGFW